MDRFSSEEARLYASQGRIEEWVHEFLLGPGKNKALSDGLHKEQRRWEGPIMVSLTLLPRICGPEEIMEYRVELQGWNAKTDAIAKAIEQGVDLPPLIVEYKDGGFHLRDGNHRHEGLRKVGKTEYWTIIWYNEAS